MLPLAKRIGTGTLLVLAPPRSGLLAVLWWAGIIAFFVSAAFYTIRGHLVAHGRNAPRTDSVDNEGPSQVALTVVFLAALVLATAILLAIRIVPGT